ncbi:MAG: hypothetical protein K2O41_02405 [Clostridia bacterium]|nr:hypothetical protein [Clostridia bacterium]
MVLGCSISSASSSSSKSYVLLLGTREVDFLSILKSTLLGAGCEKSNERSDIRCSITGLEYSHAA